MRKKITELIEQLNEMIDDNYLSSFKILFTFKSNWNKM